MEVRPGLALRQSAGVFHTRSALPGLPAGWQGISDLRARPTLTLGGNRFSAGLEVESRAGFSTVDTAGGSGSSFLGQATPLRLVSGRVDGVNENNVNVSAWIDRADLTLHAGPVDIQVGRQPLSIGNAQFVGVLDWVAPFAPGDLDATYKPGVDAVRLRGFVGGSTELEAVAVLADPVEWSGALLRSRFLLREADVEIAVGRLRERVFGGLGFAAEAGDVAYWGEAALFERRSEPVFGGGDQVALQAVAGLTWSLPHNVHLGAAGLYQDMGVREPADLLAFYIAEPATQGWLFLGSAGYLVLTLDAEATPLLRVSVSGMINGVDGSTFWQPALLYSVGDNADLSVFAWLTSGRTPETSGTLPQIRSEFGLSPSGAGLYARWFF